MLDLGTSFYGYFTYFLDFASERFAKKRMLGLAFRDVKKAVSKALKRSGFKVSRKVLQFGKMYHGKRIVVYLHDAKHGGFRFHILSSLIDYDGRFRITPIAYSTTVVYVEKIGRGILRRIASALKRNLYVSDTLAVRLLSLNPSYVSECRNMYKNVCYVCELLRVDYGKYERSYGLTWFFFDPFITGIYSSYSTSYYEAGTELETKESTPITIEEVKEVFNALINQ